MTECGCQPATTPAMRARRGGRVASLLAQARRAGKAAPTDVDCVFRNHRVAICPFLQGNKLGRAKVYGFLLINSAYNLLR